MKENLLKCLKKNGVNHEGIDFCCGNNFSNIEDIMVEKYNGIKHRLVNNFEHKIEDACMFN